MEDGMGEEVEGTIPSDWNGSKKNGAKNIVSIKISFKSFIMNQAASSTSSC